ncbi:MAG: hypothetical protein ACXAB2_13540, partial [Candidatus Hodarchaeales archaeon]
MLEIGVALEHLQNEINELSLRYRKLSEEDLFTLWFFKAYITDDEGLAINSVVNDTGDKGIDGILI